MMMDIELLAPLNSDTRLPGKKNSQRNKIKTYISV
jgi:hypothetical protein